MIAFSCKCAPRVKHLTLCESSCFFACWNMLSFCISVVCGVDFGWLLRKHFALRIWKSLGSSTLHSENFPLKQSKENKGSPSEAELGFEHVGVTWWRWKCYRCGLTTALESPNPSGKSCVASCCQSCCSVRSEFVPAIGLSVYFILVALSIKLAWGPHTHKPSGPSGLSVWLYSVGHFVLQYNHSSPV